MTQPRFQLITGTGTGTESASRSAAHEGRYWCRGCDGDVLAASLEIVSRHPTSEGTLEYVRCTAGHLGVRRRPRPLFGEPPSSSSQESAG